MASKVFVDANFILDITLKRKDFTAARELFEYALKGDIQLFTSPAVLHITSYFTSQSLGPQLTKQLLLTLLNDLTIIDCNHQTAIMAVNSSIEDVEDALQYYTSLFYQMDYFVSADKKLKRSALPQLPVVTAGQLVQELK